ncbi:MAG: hypothetical protein HRU01_23460 [Myxococcales bacterium]|nr:hypothetical protein [Myxococcales bacterium]
MSAASSGDIVRAPVLSLLTVACIALGSAGLVEALRPTVTQSHDEFSYLLTADTLLRGRLANATHPMWPHFESPHVMHQPSYVSKYPPLQGVVLAVGLVLGDPRIGAALSFALACAMTCWMLRAWIDERWAFVGSLVLAVHPQLVALWGNWLWGGGGAMLGGALVYGAVPRLGSRSRIRDGIALGLGVGLLALSRPYEGAVACVPAAALLVHGWLAKSPSRRRVSLAKGLLPIAIVISGFVAFIGHYNQRTTGDPFNLTYSVYDETYAAVPALILLPPYPAKRYHHRVLADFYGGRAHNAQYHWRRADLAGYAGGVAKKFYAYSRFFTLYGLGCVFFALPFAWRDPGVRFAVASCGLFALALSIETHEFGHYAAPIVPIATFLFTACLRRLWGMRALGIPAGPLLATLLLGFAMVEHLSVLDERLLRREESPLVERPGVIADLEGKGGRHLVVVRYADDHDVHREWVYNDADIDSAAVTWAREMAPTHNERLLRYFSDRTAWLLTPDAEKIGPFPYTPRPE